MTDSIVKYGISFLPENKRIEDQNYGRAARNGQPGTGRLILNKNEEGFTEDDIREVKKVRAQNEYDLITKSMKTEVPKHIFEDQLFDDFCVFLDEIVDINKSNEDLFKENFNKSIKERSICIKKNTEEMWGQFIRNIQNTNVSQDEDFQKYKEETIKCFNKFKQDIKKKIDDKKIFKNPFLSYKRFGKLFYDGCRLDDFSKEEYKVLLESESFLAFGIDYNYAVYNAVGAQDLKKAKEYYKKVQSKIEKFSSDFLDKIPVLNTIVINQNSIGKDLKRKIPIQKSFNNKKISFRGVIEMINQNLRLISEYEQRREKEDEIYLVRESDKYIREVLKSKTEIKEEEDLNELVQFYDDFGIENLVVLKIRKETSFFTFFVVLFTGIIEVAIGVCLCFTPYSSFGMFLLKEGMSDIKKSIEYMQGKTDINLGDWLINKSFKFLTYIVTSLLPGTEVISQAIKTTELIKTISGEILDIATEYILKQVLSELKKKISNFIKENFIDRILSIFDEVFDNIGKTISFVSNAIDSAKSYVTDIVSSFKDLIEIIKTMSHNIIQFCRNIIYFIKTIKDIKITQIPEIISKSVETMNLFNYITDKLKSLPKLVKELMNKFNFENKLKNNASKNIYCDDEQYNNLVKKYNENFDFSQTKIEEIFENKYNDCFERVNDRMKNKFEK